MERRPCSSAVCCRACGRSCRCPPALPPCRSSRSCCIPCSAPQSGRLPSPTRASRCGRTLPSSLITSTRSRTRWSSCLGRWSSGGMSGAGNRRVSSTNDPRPPYNSGMPRFLVLTLLVLAPVSTASAQLVAAKDGPIVYGHHHLNATSVDAHKKFWVDALGGVVTRMGTNDTELIKFPNALLFMRPNQKPSAGTKGSTVDHIAFSVTNLRQVVDRIKAGGFRMVTSSEAPPNITVKDDIGLVEGGPVSGIAYALGPD